MKRTLIALLIMISCKLYSQNVGIGTSSPAASAQLEVTSTTRGFLPPRVTYVQRGLIQFPVAGLSVWCSDCDTSGQMQVFNGIVWTNMIGAPASKPIPPYVLICSQAWMKKNLDVDHYRNGDPIPQVTDAAQWTGLTTGAWCWYNNDSATYAATYGRLYNWYAVSDARGLAPEGFHIPSNTEWGVLVNNCAVGSGGALKATGTDYWTAPNTGATNSTGFNALGAGYRGFDGAFVNYKLYGFWWTSTQDNGDPSTGRDWALSNNSNSALAGNSGKALAFSVRCVKD